MAEKVAKTYKKESFKKILGNIDNDNNRIS